MGGRLIGTVNAKFGTDQTPPEVVTTFLAKQRSLFRAVNAAVDRECDPTSPAPQHSDDSAFEDKPRDALIAELQVIAAT